jgi:hypothetical protein
MSDIGSIDQPLLVNTEEEKREIELYSFLRLCWMDFDGVRDSLVGLAAINKKDVRYRLLKEIVVSYARPFSANHGVLKWDRRLPREIVPVEFLPLHDKVMNLRNERFAHTDIPQFNPKVARWKTQRGWGYPMSFKGFDYETINCEVELLAQLVKQVTSGLFIEIKKIEDKFNSTISDPAEDRPSTENAS